MRMSVQPITILLVYGMHALRKREEKYFGFVKRFLANENGFSRYVMWENTVMETLP